MVIFLVIVSHYYHQSRKSCPIPLLRFYPSTLRSRSDASFPSSSTLRRVDVRTFRPCQHFPIPILELTPRTFRPTDVPTYFRAIPFPIKPLRTLLHLQKSQPLSFQAIPHSLQKTTRVGGVVNFPNLCSTIPQRTQRLSVVFFHSCLLSPTFDFPTSSSRRATNRQSRAPRPPVYRPISIFPIPYSLSPHPLSFSRNFISRTLVPISKNRQTAGQEASSHVRPQ